MAAPHRVLVAGAGRVGGLVGLLRAAQGHDVVALRRSPELLPPGLVSVGADLTDRASLARLDGPFDEVHVTTSASGRDVDAYRRAYVTGTRTLLEHLADTQPDAPRLVTFTSSTGVHGADDGRWVTEDDDPAPTRATGEVLLEAEAVLDDHPWPTCVLRLAGIYGPGSTRLVEQARGGATVAPGDDWTNRVRALDAARALAHVAGLTDPAPRYLVSDGSPVRRREVLAFLAGLVGGPEPMVDHDAEPRGGKRVDTGLLRSTGWEPAVPDHRVGYAELLVGR